MKIVRWISDNILFLLTLFFLAFIPLYPKLPILTVTHTWVYIRLEDFLVAVALIIFFIEFIRKKAAIKSPLMIPIVAFWIVGAISTVFAVLFIFPHLAGVFPKLAFLNYLRRIEYLSLFFIAYAGMKNKKLLPYVVGILVITMLLVIGYGFGQKGILVGWNHRFPAYSTMNEEFAKGTPLLLSAAGRVQSTFAGHYDLAAYLVMLIPIIGSLALGVKKWWMKLVMIATSTLGLVLLMMTASRTSFLVYLLAIAFMLVLQKKKWLIIPVFILSILLLQSFKGLSQRFTDTLSQTDVVIDARTGKVIGNATYENGDKSKIVINDIQSTGENLPQGSGYINLPGSQGGQGAQTIIKKSLNKPGGGTELTNLEGDYIVKKSLAYDISFTTRFQGEWPRAIDAFRRNILLGSGYSSITLATDNDYLRMLGETGLLGFVSFAFVFLVLGLYSWRVLPDVTSPLAKSMVIGILAGIFGLALNATLIDVFEASKVAFVLWALIGIAVGILHLYQEKKIDLVADVERVLTSVPAIAIYLLSGALGIFWMSTSNFFVGDDFTWLRWIADCKKIASTGACQSTLSTLLGFFTNSADFFYRPGTKLYFFFLYAVAWFSPFLYHIGSILMHFLASFFIYLLATKILKSKLFGFLTAVIFLSLSVHFETVFWISSIGHLLASVGILWGVYFFTLWKEKRSWYFLVLSLAGIAIAPYFHEYGVIAPLMVIAYDLIMYEWKSLAEYAHRWYLYLYLLPTPVYLLMKFISHSWWSAGDYKYNLLKLPLNIIGNSIGYLNLPLWGDMSLRYYEMLRSGANGTTPILENVTNPWFILYLLVTLAIFGYCSYFLYTQRRNIHTLRVGILSVALFIMPLLPFLGLGNVSVRYTYLSSFGVVLFAVFLLQQFVRRVPLAEKRYMLAFVCVIAGIFVVFNVADLQRINKDWMTAGTISNQLLSNMSNNFISSKEQLLPPHPVFYFVNVPIRYGEAWVFPAGLQDALWFTFQNEPFTVKTSNNLDTALAETQNQPNVLLFEFDDNGDVEQIIRPNETPAAHAK